MHHAQALSMKLVAYLRVSTDSQVDRYGLPAQRKDVQTWANSHGHKIVRWCVDEGVSGTVEATDRPGLACALEALESGGAAGLVTPKLDRLARSLSVQEAALAHVWRLGAHVFTVDTGEVHSDDQDDPMRTAMRQMMGCFAQLERAMIVQRMSKGRAAKAAAGGYAYGSPPFGWRSEGGELVADERVAPILRRIMDLHADGLSTRRIADTLATEGHKPKRSERFTSATLARIIKRELAHATT
jgi:DNA invertase Pin-like site-specific DNA recombinase